MNLKLKVRDLDCIDCARALERVARRVEGVRAATVSVALSTMELTLAEGADRRAVLRALRRKGYDLTPVDALPAARARAAKGVVSTRRLVLTSACGALLAAALIAWLVDTPPAVVRACLVGSAVAGLPLCLLRALNAVRSRSIDMNVLMTIAITAAMAIREWEEAATVAFLFSIANILEALAMARTRRAIEALVDLTPDTAVVRRGVEPVSVEASTVQPGETIIVRPGERIPLEGTVRSGSTTVDESPITGESRPVEKEPGAEVFAGTLNEEGLIEVTVTKPKEESTLARIIHLVEHIAETKAPIERFVDRFAAIYTPAVVIGAVAIAVIPWLAGARDGWVHRSLVLLIIACPCALVIATPVAIVSGLTSAAKKGILIKGGVHLEEAARISAIAFDKTGTLTSGRPAVSAIRPAPGVAESDLIAVAAAVESASTHPLAGAVLAEARRRGIHWEEPGDVRSMTGSGISAVVKGARHFAAKPAFFAERFGIEAQSTTHEEAHRTTIAVGTEHAILGTIEFADQVRPGARQALTGLRRMGITRTVMITGDRGEVAREVAAGLGIDEYHADLMPEAKVEVVRGLSRSHGHVAMVGDGVNDAPALAASNLGIAMGAAGSDAAIETADAALMSDDIGRLVPLFGISRKVRSITRQNIAFAIVVKAIFLSLGATGNATMWMAVFADMGASLIVIANALRLLSEKAMGLRGS
jgi:Cd2+/Zn2+-exporting ATPase